MPWATTKPNLLGVMSGGSNAIGQSIGYLRAMLCFSSGYTALKPIANWGPWTYFPCIDAVKQFQAYWGLPVTGQVNWTRSTPTTPSDWEMVDAVYKWTHGLA